MIQNKLSNLYLDIKGATTQTGGEAILWKKPAKKTPTNQQFYVKNVGNGYVTLSPRHSKMFLSYATDEGSPIVQMNSEEKWIIKKQNDGWFKIVNRFSGMCFDIYNDLTKPGTNVIVWPENNTNDSNQKWKFIKVN
jgi:hypothetical protein